MYYISIQKLNGTESQRTPKVGPCVCCVSFVLLLFVFLCYGLVWKKVTRAIKYPGLGVRSVGPTVGDFLEYDIFGGIPPPTNSEIIICSFLWRDLFDKTLHLPTVGQGIPPNYIIIAGYLI